MWAWFRNGQKKKIFARALRAIVFLSTGGPGSALLITEPPPAINEIVVHAFTKNVILTL